MSRATLAVAVCAMVACKRAPATQASHRMEIRLVTDNTVQFIPAPDQLPYCLIYTQSDKGVTRQMTMTQSNQSVLCPPGEPVLGLRFRIPADEGRVQVRCSSLTSASRRPLWPPKLWRWPIPPSTQWT